VLTGLLAAGRPARRLDEELPVGEDLLDHHAHGAHESGRAARTQSEPARP
jgi:hypothetical protein